MLCHVLPCHATMSDCANREDIYAMIKDGREGYNVRYDASVPRLSSSPSSSSGILWYPTKRVQLCRDSLTCSVAGPATEVKAKTPRNLGAPGLAQRRQGLA
eukprot:96064-Pyramimonas_sp.AAC.1